MMCIINVRNVVNLRVSVTQLYSAVVIIIALSVDQIQKIHSNNHGWIRSCDQAIVRPALYHPDHHDHGQYVICIVISCLYI